MSDFIIRIFKAWRGRDISRAWSNTYEIISGADNPTELVAVGDALVAAERIIHLTDVNFLQYTISTWAPDSHPYNPETFVTYTLAVDGQRGNDSGVNDNALDYNVCYMIHRNATTGRSGRLFFRGCLMETDVMIQGDGRFAIEGTGAGEVDTKTQAFKTALAPYITGGTGNQLALISKSGSTIYRRNVVDIVAGGVVINKKNHRYFDRA